MDEQEVCAGTPVGCRAAPGFVEKELCEAAQLLVVESGRRGHRSPRLPRIPA
jgi:hypothetical protein